MYTELLGDLGGGERRVRHQGTRHLDLIWAEDARTTELLASAARRVEAGLGAFAQDLGFHFGERGEDVEGELARRRGRVE